MDGTSLGQKTERIGMALFQLGKFQLHAGALSAWKIDCDNLTDDDIHTLARMLVDYLPAFNAVEGVPRGGVRLARALRCHSTPDAATLLIVDDVLTTGSSLEQQRNGRPAVGAVLFARGPCPEWVTPLFQMPT